MQITDCILTKEVIFPYDNENTRLFFTNTSAKV